MSEEMIMSELEQEEMTEEPKTVKISQGLTAEQYDNSEPMIEGEEDPDISGIEVHYDLREEEVKLALKAFQKKMVFKKNVIYTIALIVLGVMYLVSVLNNPDYTMGYILGALSIVIIGLIWYLPVRHIRLTAKAVGAANDTFFIEVCEQGFLLREGDGKYLIGYDKPMVSVVELPELFVICVTKEKMFALPKRCIEPEKMDEIKALMKAGLGDKYAEREQ